MLSSVEVRESVQRLEQEVGQQRVAPKHRRKHNPGLQVPVDRDLEGVGRFPEKVHQRRLGRPVGADDGNGGDPGLGQTGSSHVETLQHLRQLLGNDRRNISGNEPAEKIGGRCRRAVNGLDFCEAGPTQEQQKQTPDNHRRG